MSSKTIKYGLLAAAAVGAILLRQNFSNLKTISQDLAKSLQEKAKLKLKPERVNFC